MSDIGHRGGAPHVEPQVAASDGARRGRPFAIVGFVCAAIAVFILPPVLGAIGVVLGFVARARGDRKLGLWAIIASIAGAVLGMILGAIVLNATDDDAAAALALLAG